MPRSTRHLAASAVIAVSLAAVCVGCGSDAASHTDSDTGTDRPSSAAAGTPGTLVTPGTPLALTPPGWPALPVPATERSTDLSGVTESVEYDTTATPLEVLDGYEPLLSAIDGATVVRGGAELSSDGNERLTGQIGTVVYEVVPHDGWFRITFAPD